MTIEKNERDPQTIYPPLSIANYFIKKASEENSPLTLMKLIKLIYVAYGWYLALYDKELINEPIQAWKYGPVVETVYHEFKHYANRPIDQVASDYGYDKNGVFIKIDYEIDIKDKDTRAFLDKIWEVYKGYTGIQLSNWTHYEGSPWFIVWYNHQGQYKKSYPIPNEIIKNYFKQMADKN